MRRRIQVIALAVAVGAGLAIATKADANHATRTLQVHPEVVWTAAAPGAGYVLTAELSAAVDGTSGSIQIDFEVESGPGDTDGATRTTPDLSCTVSSGTECTTAPIPGPSTGTSTVRVWIDHDKNNASVEADSAEARLSQPVVPPIVGTSPDCEPEDGTKANCQAGVADPGAVAEPDSTDVVEITYTSEPAKLDCDDSSGDDVETNNPTDPETYTCTVTDQFDTPLGNVRVDAENLDGVNDPDNASAEPTDYNPGPGTGSGSFCTTDGLGTCSQAIPAFETQEGIAKICFWIDEPATPDDQTFNDSGLSETDGGDCAAEIRAETENNDITDKVAITWDSATPSTTTTTTTSTTTSTTTTSTTTSTSTTTTAPTTTTTTTPPPPPSQRGYVLDGFGKIYGYGGMANPNTGAGFGSDVARDIAVRDTTSGYVLDAFGGIARFGGAPNVDTGGRFGSPVARAIVLRSNGTSGYVLDGFGGIAAFGGAPKVDTGGRFGSDIARDIVLQTGQDNRGWVLDGLGGIHPFGGAPNVDTGGRFGGDLAKAITVRSDGAGGYVLDGFGGVAAFGGAPKVDTGRRFASNIARDLTLETTGGQLLDGIGGVAPFAGAVSRDTGGRFGSDIARGIVSAVSKLN